MPQLTVRGTLALVRRGWLTTPGRLRAIGAGLVLAAACAGVLVAAAADHRRDAVATATQSEDLLHRTQRLTWALSDADAAVALAFVVGGVESTDSRARFDLGLRIAAAELAKITAGAKDAPRVADAVRRISVLLPVYAGLVEIARTNYRQGYPLGAAYLRRASKLMREQMLVAAVTLFEVQASALDASYRDGASWPALLVVVAACAGLLTLLVLAQIVVSRVTRRRLNLGLLLASVTALTVAVWAAVALTAQRDALVRAQREGSDSIQVLSAIRILALRAQAAESQALIARGSGELLLEDFDASAALIRAGAPDSLLDEAKTIAERYGAGSHIDELRSTFERYLEAHDRVVERQRKGDFDTAVRLAVGQGDSRSEIELGDEFTDGVAAELAAGQHAFGTASGDAASALRGLALGVPLFCFLCAGLALAGLRPRIEEYR